MTTLILGIGMLGLWMAIARPEDPKMIDYWKFPRRPLDWLLIVEIGLVLIDAFKP